MRGLTKDSNIGVQRSSRRNKSLLLRYLINQSSKIKRMCLKWIELGTTFNYTYIQTHKIDVDFLNKL